MGRGDEVVGDAAVALGLRSCWWLRECDVSVYGLISFDYVGLPDEYELAVVVDYLFIRENNLQTYLQ